MKRSAIGLLLFFLTALSTPLFSQLKPYTFGKGFNLEGKDSSFHLNLAFRMQNLHVSDWDIVDGEFENYNAAFLIRRSRIKMKGWALTPKLKYKFELGMTNRDNGGANTLEFRNAQNMILDAWVEWNFYQNFKIKFGQGKLPGNRERVISSADLQFVDRSQLNSRFNIDRDVGLQFGHHFVLGENFIVKEVIAVTQGEGRNITAGYFDGMAYTFKVEVYPFGAFASKGDYVGSAIKYEEKPKLAVLAAYHISNNAVRERGQLGSFIKDENGTYYGKDISSFFVDLMFKYKSLSVMAEYANRQVEDDNPDVFDENMNVIGTFYTGSAYNVQAGYMLKGNWEIAARYTNVVPDTGVGVEENQYTLGLSKFVVGHKLKVQTDVTLIEKDATDDKSFLWRTQVDFHF